MLQARNKRWALAGFATMLDNGDGPDGIESDTPHG
jgi:hypothetical protein